MDGLIHHCLREISFDGDLGCDVSRLSHFIEEYYSGGSDPNIKSQTVDEAFRAFVWSLVVQETSVSVGLVPEGSSPVYIAPQPSVVRKQAKAQIAAPSEPSNSPAKLESLASAEVQESSLPELVQKYGETLRIAVDHETSFQAITGTHVRSPKLGAMTYTALQFITRSRVEGISMKGLGDATGYDQKTVHYLVGQLLELGLILKIRISGISKHACIHKYFYPKSRFYVAEPDTKIDVDFDVDDEEDHQSTLAADDAVPSDSIFAHDPIDPRTLTIDSVLRSRLVTLLKNSPNHLHRSENIILALGCHSPTRSDRRFVNHRIRIFMKEGWIEKVYAPNKKFPQSRVLCIRLLDQHSSEAEGLVPAIEEGLKQSDPNSQPIVNVSIQHQILKLIHDSGSEGMTTNDIAARLGNLDRRTLDHMITKLLRDVNPPHLADLTILQMRESLKREHRHKYYTVQHYGTMLEEMGAPPPAKSSLPDTDESAIGGWGSFTEDAFYQNETDLLTTAPPNTRLVYNQTKPPIQKRTNPIGPDGKYVKGRPRNEWSGGVSRPVKKKKVEPKDQLDDEDPSKPKRRGRKRKVVEADLEGDGAGPSGVSGGAETQPPLKKKRGRPKKSEQAKSLTIDIQPTLAAPLPTAVSPTVVHSSDPVILGTAEASPSGDVAMQDVGLTPFRPPLSAALSPTTAVLSTATITIPLPTVNPESIELGHATSLLPDQVQESLAMAEQRESPIPGDERPAKRTRLGGGVSSNQEHLEPPISPDALSILADTASRQPRRTGVNITYMRREKEILHLIAEGGGVSLADWTLTKRHTALVEKWDKEGRPVSGPAGTSCDKRTMANLLNTMEDNGVIKRLVTTVPDGPARKQVHIVFMPDVTEEAVRTFVGTLGNRVNAARALPKHSYGYADVTYREMKVPSRFARINASVEDADLVKVSPIDARMELLQDARTCAQLFGFIAGRMARARELHLYTLSQLSDLAAESSPGIVSRSDSIVSTQYFWTDIPISTYCSIVSVNMHHPALEDILADVEKRDTLVSELPQDLRDVLETGKARSRYKIAEVLDLLRQLGVVVPIQASEGGSTVNENTTGTPTNLSFIAIQQTRTPPVDVHYWQFNLIAPVYRFSDPEKPSLLGHVPIATVEESVEYWMACREAALRKDYILESEAEAEAENSSAQFDGDSELQRSITRYATWSNEYRLSSKQMDYLARFVDGATGTIPQPMDTENANDPFNVLCYAAAAPPSAVTRYLEQMSKDIKASHARKAQEQFRQKNATDMQEDARKLLALKVKETKQRLQRDWDAALASVHPGPLTQEELKSPSLSRLKRSFIAAGGNLQVAALHSAIKEALSPRPPLVPSGSNARLPISRPSKKALSTPKEPPTSPASVPRRDDAISRSVLDLVNRQQPRKHETSKEKKERRAAAGGPQKRGQRFLWSSEFDELAIDATCILAARGRSNGTISWMAMPQVFPGVDSNGVRTRISRLREDPAVQAYMFKLEEAWYHLWMQKRGTEELPDSNPDSPVDFDLISHVVYLREHIDKPRLRSGSAQKTSATSEIDLPSNIVNLERDFEVLRVAESQDDQWDFMFNQLGDETRERNFYRESLKHGLTSRRAELLPDSDGVARAALAMVLETPGESYKVDIADSMLGSCGERHVSSAISNLEKDNCITKVISDSAKHVPGRHWRWQEWLEDFKSGPLHHKLYSGAQSFVDDLEADGQQDLPYVISDGTMVALLNIASEDKVAIAVDTSHPAEVRHEVDGNSKKVVDDQLETSINVRLRQLRIQNIGDDNPLPINEPDGSAEPMMGVEPTTSSFPHGIPPEAGQSVCCAEEGARSGHEVFNCDGCLQTARWNVLSTLSESDRKWVERSMELVDNAGPEGLSPTMLDLDDAKWQLLDQLTYATVPLAFWAGYTSPLLVGGKYASAWTVSIPIPGRGVNDKSHVRMVLPRRWLDIHGNLIEKTWNAALKHVVSWVWLRPRISLLHLRSRVKPLFDRQETLEIVIHLVRKDTLALHWDPSIVGSGAREIQSLTDDESKKVWISVEDEGMEESWYTLPA
ncbi:hypothetical protein M407DRAFT_216113 [Tulasnella calospora MUT 4182]|uniref:Uncharacterized protein n=1 Tax=Tulasnella calospora MUT 4182 TaxID=1051891 RepID=A0A0C3QDC1_9AGAM|nr:hypothetical protein M407DRAFT_216113 [Tulasnella calospora MUT 4182]